MQFSTTVAIVLASTALVHGWGYSGHRLTAAVAQEFLDKTTLVDIGALLGAKQTILSVSTWADEIKRQARYRWTSELHYSNPLDDEPKYCSYDFRRDCAKERCVVGAIYNFTSTFNPATRAPKALREEALKFLVHFLGDLHQPLHVSGRDKGGNNADCRFDGAATNLHVIWDSSMLEKRIKEKFQNSAQVYLQYLLKRLHTEWQREVALWTSCRLDEEQNDDQQMIFNQPKAICPDKWAAEINRLNCQFVWPAYAPGSDLARSYYEKNIDVVEKLIVMGGIRLASILNNFYN